MSNDKLVQVNVHIDHTVMFQVSPKIAKAIEDDPEIEQTIFDLAIKVINGEVYGYREGIGAGKIIFTDTSVEVIE
jgi:hypothetical protein